VSDDESEIDSVKLQLQFDPERPHVPDIPSELFMLVWSALHTLAFTVTVEPARSEMHVDDNDRVLVTTVFVL
jgi:hypothetical protein